MLEYLKIAGIAMLVILAAKFILHLDLKKVIGIAINALIGMIALWLINLTGLVSIPINIITCLVVGIFGVPGTIVLIVLSLLIKSPVIDKKSPVITGNNYF